MLPLRFTSSAAFALLCVAVVACGCSEDPRPPVMDVPPAVDVVPDTAPDVPAMDSVDVPSMDAAPDVGIDATPDVASGPDVPPDAPADSPADAPDVTDVADVTDAAADVQPTCPADQIACAGQCVDTLWSETHCGGCGTLCPPGMACSRGRCASACDPPRAMCVTGGLARCVDLQTDLASCGMCGRSCSEGQMCEGGRCVCATGRTLCGMRCADTESDPGNCGGCGVTCPAVVNGRAACRRGVCGFACAEGFHVCGNACVSNGSPLTCGTLCVACPTYPNASPTCDGTACSFACIMGFHRCGAACVSDLAIATCGTLCTPCPTVANATTTCDGRACGFTCNPGFHRCGDVCVANTSVLGCGMSCDACMAAANAAATCDGRACGLACTTGFGNCDMVPDNGCEADLRVTPEHCSACGRACTAPANARPTCTASTCGFACNAGFANCDTNPTNGCETEVGSNTAHCGMCARACATGEVCSGGTCRLPRLGWAERFGSPVDDAGLAITRDPAGNLYVVGRFRETFATDVGTISSNGAQDGFLLALAPDGAVRWVRRFGSTDDDAAFGVAVDPNSSHVYVTGRFRGNADFGGATLRSSGDYDAFVASWTDAGTFRWARGYGVDGADAAQAVAVDAMGRVYATGTFRGNVDFGGGVLPGTAGGDVFVLSLNADGTHRWSRRFGGTSARAGGGTGYGLALTADGALLVTGLFSGAVDFGSDLVVSAGNFDIFVENLTAASGAHQWVRRFGAANVDWGYGVTADATGNIYVTGYFQGAVDFGGGALTGGVGTDGFLVSLNRMGAHRWSRRFGGSTSFFGNAAAQAVALDSSGNVTVTGSFAGNVDFGGGLRTSVGDSDLFIASWTSAGTPRWSRRFGADRRDEGHGVTTDAVGNVYVTGEFENGVDFGGGRVDSIGAADVFVLQYVQ